MRNVMVANSTKNGVGVLDYSVEYIERLNNQAKDMSMNTAKVIMKELSKLEQEIKNSINQKASLEVGLLNMCDLQMPEPHEKHPSENLVARVYELEAILKQLVSGGVLQAEKVVNQEPSVEIKTEPIS
ncbi:MAG: hypothetical protein KHY44_08965 [Clostridiales bacterium]|jgi:DNA polymerase-3 subunit gamma/tau|nr:hypothetical protein [Clostridiales bacterium]